ncbi:aspartokinase 1, chloroplastic-like [Triticum dicoccoides]|uniref:aspartokinase 1, chloroplastic-like n=1 Tax=Triticum dicoccoides TaxID=85692 RepID=UPI001890EF90|nr:aspartokinase 1, chloroplastic-like [Triticum dicoccoides]
MNFGGSSIPTAERMKEMAKLVLSSENPALVMSAMDNTTTNIFLAAWTALTGGVRKASEIRELIITKQLHLRTIDELGLDSTTVSGCLDELESHLQYVAMTKELTPRTRDYLVFFGQRTSTKIFFEYLNKLGKGTLQEWELRPVTTFGRVGSDLAAAIIARDLGSAEIQAWKDQDSIFTCDPKVCAKAIPLPHLTFDEAADIGFFAAKSIQIAMEGGKKVIVKNSYNPQACGTAITKTRDMSKSTLTSIVLESNITILDIERTSELNQEAFVVKALDNAVEELKKFATVDRQQNRSVISLVGMPQMSTAILEKALNVLRSMYVDVEKVSQGPFKVTKVLLMVHDSEAKDCVQALHSAFFEDGFVSELQGSEKECQIPVNSSAAAVASSSGAKKRKAGDDHLEAPLGVRQLQTLGTDADGRPGEAEALVSPYPVPVGGHNLWEDDYLMGNNFGQSDYLWPPLPFVDHDAVQNAIEEAQRGAGTPHQWYRHTYYSYSGTKQMERRHQQRRWYNLWSLTNYSPDNVFKFLTPFVVLLLAACLARFLAKRSSME